MTPNETLEEAFEKWADQQSEKGVGYDKVDVLKFGAQWQAENSFSKEDMVDFAIFYYKHQGTGYQYWGKDMFQAWQNEKLKNLPNSTQ